jgi:hypothetical protein
MASSVHYFTSEAYRELLCKFPKVPLRVSRKHAFSVEYQTLLGRLPIPKRGFSLKV